jgi:amino acid transporter
MPLSLMNLLVGRPIANREAESQKLGVATGVPAMGLDGLESASYGPEAALTVLAATGAAGLSAIGPITWVILLLLTILFLSYWQTIAAYPNSGGSYVVAKENLGINSGLLARSRSSSKPFAHRLSRRVPMRVAVMISTDWQRDRSHAEIISLVAILSSRHRVLRIEPLTPNAGSREAHNSSAGQR